MTPEDKLFYICGSYFLAEGPELRDYYADSLKTMKKTAPEFRKMQFVKVCTPAILDFLTDILLRETPKMRRG